MNDISKPEKLTKTQQLQQIAQRLSKLPEDKKSAFRQALQNKGIDPWKLPIVSLRAETKDYPLSFAQQRLWFVEQMEEDRTLYNLVFGLRFEGALDVKALELSLHEICRRHSVLRTTFYSNEHGEGRQQIQPFESWELDVENLDVKDVELEYLDVDGLDVDKLNARTEKDKLLEKAIEVEARKPFDLTTDLMFRFKLMQMGPKDTVGLFTIHHIAFDFLSVELMVREVAILYSHFQEDHKRSASHLLCELPIQYADFASWQRQWAASNNYQTQKSYWLQQLAELPPRINLPSDYLPRTPRRHVGLREGLLLTPELSDQLRSLAQQHNVTLYMLLLSVFTLLLHRYSQQDDIAVGTSIANRGRPEIENVLGFFVNLLVMRNRLAPEQSFLSFLQQVNETAAAAYDHQDLPFDHLIDLLGVPRDPTSSPIFQVLFVLTMSDQSAEAQVLPGVKVSSFSHDQGIARYELTLRVSDNGVGNALFCQFEYDCDIYKQSTVVNMLRHYQYLCDSIVVEPQSLLRDLRFIDEKNKQQLTGSLLLEKPNESVDIPAAIHHLFETHVLAQSETLAVVYEDQTLSYAELNVKANQLAHHLRGLGLGRENRVALYMERSISLVIGLLAVLKAGAAYVPLDVKWPQQRIKTLLADADVNCILSELCWQEPLSDISTDTDIKKKEVLYLDAPESAWANQSHTNPESINKVDDAAYVIFTSGSTGKPKGVVIEHRQIIHYSQSVMSRLINGYVSNDEVSNNKGALKGKSFAHISTIAADLGNTSLYGALCFGGCLHLISTERAFEPDSVAQYMDEHKVDVLKIVPSHLHGLLSAEQPSRLLPKSILILGGEACSNTLLKQIRDLSPSLRIINHYGPTETTVGVLTHELKREEGINPFQRIPLGRPLANTQVYVLDSELQLCSIGIPGELYIGGAGVARGYLNQSKMTAERFIANPFFDQSVIEHENVSEDAPRLYRTGDRVRYLENGDLEFLGRIDNQVKIRGYRVELGDIEAALRQQLWVDDVAVRLVQGEVSDQLIAYMVLTEKAAGEQQTIVKLILDQLNINLPVYMIPQKFEVLDSLPLTLNGKLDGKKLDAISRKQSKSDSQNENQSHAVRVKSKRAPRNEKEISLLGLIKEVLRREDVDSDDNFFELGGDSILSLQVIAKAKRKGLKITPKQFVEQATIMHLAEVAMVIENSKPKKSQMISGDVPLTPIQQWFFDSEHPIPEHWNQSLLFQAKEGLNGEALQAAVATIVRHHDQLRSEFIVAKDGSIQQRVMPFNNDVRSDYFIIQPCADEGEPRKFLAQLNQYHTVLRLQNKNDCGQLFKVVYFVGNEQTPDRLLILAHHLLVDGVSWRVLLEDFLVAYQHHLKAPSGSVNTEVLQTKTTSFQQWSRTLLNTAKQHDQRWHEAARSYWQSMREQLDQDLSAINSKVINSKVFVQTEKKYTLDQVQKNSFVLNAELTTGLLQEAGKAYKTRINDLLLSALCIAFSKQVEGKALYLELEGHGREELDKNQDLSRTVGWFTSRFPVLLNAASVTGIDNGINSGINSETAELIHTVKKQLSELPLQGLSYGLLKYLDDMSELPKPTVSFNYLGQVEVQDAQQWFESVPDMGTVIERHPKSNVSQPLAINAIIVEGRLELRFDYVPEALDLDIKRLGEDYLNALESVIEHCVNKQSSMCFLDASNVQEIKEPSPVNNINALIETGAQASKLDILHPLRVLPGSRNELALFCIHHVGGHTREYQSIAQQFPSEIPIYGIQARRMIKPEALEVSFYAMAEDYVQMMREVQPFGPYRLLGWSIGGLIAMVITKILEKQGQDVSFVGLIDSTMGAQTSNDDTLLDNLMRVIDEGKHDALSGIDNAERKKLIRHLKTLEKPQAIENIIQWASEKHIFDVEESRHLILTEDLKRHYRKLREAHTFEAVNANLHVWWAKGSLRNGLWPVRWQDYCRTIASSATFSGDHYDIVADPKVHESIVNRFLETCSALGDK